MSDIIRRVCNSRLIIFAAIRASALKGISRLHRFFLSLFFWRAKGSSPASSSSITVSPTHASSSFFAAGQSRSPRQSRHRSPRLLNYESPPSFTFIYRCAIPLDLPPRFSRLLFLFFVPPPSNLLFRREIPLRLLSAEHPSLVRNADEVGIITSSVESTARFDRNKPVTIRMLREK